MIIFRMSQIQKKKKKIAPGQANQTKGPVQLGNKHFWLCSPKLYFGRFECHMKYSEQTRIFWRRKKPANIWPSKGRDPSSKDPPLSKRNPVWASLFMYRAVPWTSNFLEHRSQQHWVKVFKVILNNQPLVLDTFFNFFSVLDRDVGVCVVLTQAGVLGVGGGLILSLQAATLLGIGFRFHFHSN